VVDQQPRTPSLKISRALVREHYFDGIVPHPAVGRPEAEPTEEPA